MYEITFSDKAKRQFLKLEKIIQERIGAVLERIKIRPETHFQRLVGSDTYKLRVGDYRIIVDIDQGDLIVLVLEIGHRKNIYDRL